jgi:hypothetical protein
VGLPQVELRIMVTTVAGHGMRRPERRSRWESERRIAFWASSVEGLQREALSPLSDSEVEAEAEGAGHPGGVGWDDPHGGCEENPNQNEGEGSCSAPGPGSRDRVDNGPARRESKEGDGPG